MDYSSSPAMLKVRYALSTSGIQVDSRLVYCTLAWNK